MSIQKIFDSLFGQTNISKIAPKFDLEDAELGDISKKIKDKDIYYNFQYELGYPDLELGFGPIVEIHTNNIYIDINMLQKNNIFYISFIESIRYFVSPYKEHVSTALKDIYPSLWETKGVNNNVHIPIV